AYRSARSCRRRPTDWELACALRRSGCRQAKQEANMSNPDSQTPLDTEETNRLIASDQVEGTAVYNTQAERLGSVYNFMVDKRSGQVEYAVMSFGGFLGMGDSYHPLPWKTLTYDTS